MNNAVHYILSIVLHIFIKYIIIFFKRKNTFLNCCSVNAQFVLSSLSLLILRIHETQCIFLSALDVQQSPPNKCSCYNFFHLLRLKKPQCFSPNKQLGVNRVSKTILKMIYIVVYIHNSIGGVFQISTVHELEHCCKQPKYSSLHTVH